MKVKEYLVNRILKLEEELKRTQNEKAGTAFGLQKLQEDVIKLNEKIEQYQIEREHIKEIITCNIGRDAYNHLGVNIDIGNNDFKTLLAILDIKSEDYTDNKDIPVLCDKCEFQDVDYNNYPCNSCECNHNFVAKGGDTDAEDTD